MAKATVKDVLLQVCRVWKRLAQDGLMSINTVDEYIEVCERLLGYAYAHQITFIDEITPNLAQAFVNAPGRDRRGIIIETPAGSTQRQRRSAVISLFAHARALGLTKAAPLVDARPIRRSPRQPGADLQPQEIARLQFHSERGMPATRHSALLALLLAGLTSAETGAASTTDLDLTSGRVHTRGATHTLARTCTLDAWSIHVLTLRTTYLDRKRPGPHRLVANAGSSPSVVQSSIGAGFSEIARRSGLSTTARKVEPRDVTRYVARQILNETGQLSEVARRLGLSSLDVAAGLADLQWNTPQRGGAR
ncbi:hypothetical protein M8Z33_09630 [Streptomyces sp. ZAF1911]|uniref:hypothetical protein n=1 Tax=Streptomyces sp. ZAF1911 TaxID=2944129 RepID=UPI00237BB31C|nr:hypothetical protein [Streptomyces sp. ZAF1911]MDD9376922.1 hypothetical protein [Streptomyces sp. ZAF1911]